MNFLENIAIVLESFAEFMPWFRRFYSFLFYCLEYHTALIVIHLMLLIHDYKYSKCTENKFSKTTKMMFC